MRIIYPVDVPTSSTPTPRGCAWRASAAYPMRRQPSRPRPTIWHRKRRHNKSNQNGISSAGTCIIAAHLCVNGQRLGLHCLRQPEAPLAASPLWSRPLVGKGSCPCYRPHSPPPRALLGPLDAETHQVHKIIFPCK